MMGTALDHPAVNLPVAAVLASNPWWVEYINGATPLLSFAALLIGVVYGGLQVAHLIKHWNDPKPPH